MNQIIIPVLILLASWLGACRCSLRGLTGGLIRTLEDPLQSHCQYFFERCRKLGFALRLAGFLVTVTYTLIVYKEFVKPAVAEARPEAWFCFALSIFIYVFIQEFLGSSGMSHRNVRILHYSYKPLRILLFLLYPYVVLMMKLVEFMIKRTDEGEDNLPKVSAEDEIMSLVEIEAADHDEDCLEQQEKRMIKRVFNLDDTRIREVMTPRTSVQGVEKRKSLTEIQDRFVETGFSRLPVYDKKPDQIVGVLYAKDFLDHKRVQKSSIEDLLHQADFVNEADPLNIILNDFRRKKIHFAVVKDEFGGTDGIVTMEDILEEIVGEIHDEFDEEEDHFIRPQEDGSVILDPRAQIYDINEQLNTFLPDEEFDTIGAMIFSITGDIPTTGTYVDAEHFTAEILEADDRSIISLSLRIKQVDSVD